MDGNWAGPRSDRDWLTSGEVMKDLGITYRNLVYWSMEGHIPGQENGPGSGGQRRWTPEQVERAREIRDAHREVARILREAHLPLGVFEVHG